MPPHDGVLMSKGKVGKKVRMLKGDWKTPNRAKITGEATMKNFHDDYVYHLQKLKFEKESNRNERRFLVLSQCLHKRAFLEFRKAEISGEN